MLDPTVVGSMDKTHLSSKVNFFILVVVLERHVKTCIVMST